MLRAWYFRWMVAGIIFWVGGLAVGLALLASAPRPGRRAQIKIHSGASVPYTGEQVSPGKHRLQRRDNASVE